MNLSQKCNFCPRWTVLHWSVLNHALGRNVNPRNRGASFSYSWCTIWL